MTLARHVDLPVLLYVGPSRNVQNWELDSGPSPSDVNTHSKRIEIRIGFIDLFSAGPSWAPGSLLESFCSNFDTQRCLQPVYKGSTHKTFTPVAKHRKRRIGRPTDGSGNLLLLKKSSQNLSYARHERYSQSELGLQWPSYMI